MERVEITRRMLDPKEAGIYALVFMQVCVEDNPENPVTTEEILRKCNMDNPCGTTNGWSIVHWEDSDLMQGAVHCEDFPDRIHLMVSC